MSNLEIVKLLCADHVIVYIKVNLANQNKTYEIKFDTIWQESIFRLYKVKRNKKGIFLNAVHITPLSLF